jgi:hypothetical protein
MPAANDASARVDAYIEKSAAFARPILARIRKLFHEACPAVEETIKWGMPHFEHRGILGGMAAFKQHVRFGFWRGRQLKEWSAFFEGIGKTDMSALKVAALSELPRDAALLRAIREAVALNEAGPSAAARRRPRRARKPLPVPGDLRAALRKNRKALATFEAFSPSHRREYVEWIVEARRDETRARRLATAVEWMAEGKPHNWKYMRK